MQSTDEEINKAIEQFLKDKDCSTIDEAQDIDNYLKSKTWKEREASFLDKVQHTCEACRSTVNVQAVHNNYSRIYAEQNEDLLALCRACQNKRNSKIKPKSLANKKRISKNTTKRLSKSKRRKKSTPWQATTNLYGVVENSYTEQYEKIHEKKIKKCGSKVGKSKYICFSCCDSRKSTKKVQAHTRVIRLCTRCCKMFNIA